MTIPKPQQILEALPVLPAGVWINDLASQLYGPQEDKTGFRHSSGEWQLLYKHEGRMHRLPESMALTMLINKRNFT